MVDDDDLAFVQWASKRHAWLWRVAHTKRFCPQRVRRIAVVAGIGLMRVDRWCWQTFRLQAPHW